MNVGRLRVDEFLQVLDNYKDENQIVNLIKQYFNYRIMNNIIFFKDELIRIEEFAKKIINDFEYCKNSKDIIIIEIEKVLVFSKNKNEYDDFCKLLCKKTKEFNSEEILNFISIVLNSCYCCFTVSQFDVYIRRYLEIDGNIKNIYKIIDDNANVFTQRELRYLDKFIYNNNLNIFLLNIFNELNKSEISSVNIYENMKNMLDIKFDKINSNNLILIRDIIDKINDSIIISKMDGISKNEVIRLCDIINDNIFNNSNDDIRFKNNIMLGNLCLTNSFSDECMSSIKFINYNLFKIRDERIITIDDPLSPDLDGAFSIGRNADGFVLKVYISDVPVFLRDNRKLCQEVYLRGCSMYVRDYNNKCNINIDMLPQYLSHQYLSLNLGGCKDVIVFTFCIGNDGVIYSKNIDRKNIVVTDKLSPDMAKKIIYSDEDYGEIQSDLRNYRDLCRVMVRNASDKFLSRLNYNKMSDLIGFPSVFVNYYIGHEALFAIYRENGNYTVDNSDYYTHSVTPIRKFVSNINLAFFLEQNGVVSFPSRDLYYVKDNIKEILEHLNLRNSLSRSVEKNSNLVRKYLK